MTSASAEQFPDPTFKPFSTRRIPAFSIAAEQLVTDRENEVRNHIDVLGSQLFQARDDVLSTLERLGADSAYRAKLGLLRARELEAFASLSPEGRTLALSVAELAMNRLIDSFAQTLSGGERAYPGNHCIEYSIDSTVLAITGASANGVKLKRLSKCRITGDANATLATAFGRWVNTFGRWKKHV